jgi:chitin disaccharide deacetylase
VRRLIVNADDFGLTSGVNRAIIEAHQAGIVTSATLMANSARFDQAVQLSLRFPQLSVGCHVVLVDGIPVADPSRVSSLVTSNAGGATFYESLSAFAAAAIAGRIEPAHVEAEATAQIRKIQAAGLTISHLDTHKHTHVFPAVWKPLLRAAIACGIGAIRNPFVPTHAVSMAPLRQRPAMLKRYMQVQVLRIGLANRFRRAVNQAGLATPHGSFGVIETGHLDQFLLDCILDCVPEGTWELVCHPGHDDEELAGIRTRLRRSRAQELALLTSPGIRERLSQRGIELISYRDLTSTA